MCLLCVCVIILVQITYLDSTNIAICVIVILNCVGENLLCLHVYLVSCTTSQV